MRRYAESMALLKEARDLFRDLGNQRREGACLTAMALTLQRTGRYADVLGGRAPVGIAGQL